MTADRHPGELLSAYLDDELAGDEAREVEAHLVRCSRCSAEVDELAAARRLLRGLPPVPAPPGFTAALIEQRRRWSRRGAGLALAAAGVALLAGLALAEPPEDDPSPPSQPLSLTGESSRLDTTTFGSGPGTSPAPDEPMLAQGGDGGSTTTTASSTTPSTSTTTTTVAGRDTGPDDESDPVTVGDRLDEVAANLLELIGG